MMSDDIDRLLNLLMHESAQARDDDRYMFAQFATIISAAVVLILAMAALFYQTCLDVSCPTDPNSKLTPVPLWVYVSAPILPTVLVAYGVLLATVQGLRSYYIRTIEVRIHQLTNQHHINLPIPSWGHLQIDVTGNTHSRGFARLSWLLIDIIILLLVMACIYLATSKIVEIRHRVFALVVDMSLLIIQKRHPNPITLCKSARRGNVIS